MRTFFVNVKILQNPEIVTVIVRGSEILSSLPFPHEISVVGDFRSDRMEKHKLNLYLIPFRVWRRRFCVSVATAEGFCRILGACWMGFFPCVAEAFLRLRCDGGGLFCRILGACWMGFFPCVAEAFCVSVATEWERYQAFENNEKEET